MIKKLIPLCVFLILLGISVETVHAGPNEAKQFYNGAQITFVVPYSPGGGYDTWARMLAPHLSKHTGAKILVQNMKGAGGLLGAGFLYNNSKPDGLTISIMPMPGMTVVTMLEFEGVKFDLDKFSYIGRVEAMDRGLVASKASGFKTIEDLQKSSSPIRYGTTDPAAETSVESSLLAEIFGIKTKIIPGYKGSKAYILALIAGRELDATSMSMGGYDKYIESGDITMVASLGEKRLAKFPDIPTFRETPIKNQEAKAYADLLSQYTIVGRSILAPPGVSPERLQFLENALKASLKEPEIVKWATKKGYNLNWLPGKECKELVAKTLQLIPKAERPKLKQIVMKKYY